MIHAHLTPLGRQNLAALALLIAGSMQMIGYAMRSDTVRAVAAASAFAPLPGDFADVDGFEAFASELTLGYRDAAGATHELRLTPERYARLGGSDERRRVYGTALFYAPRLPESLWMSVYCHGMEAGGPLRRALELSDDDARVAITIRTLTRGRHDEWTFEPACSR